MASISEAAHQQHVQRLKTLGSKAHFNVPIANLTEDDTDEDPDEVAYRERLKSLASSADEVVDFSELSAEQNAASARRATDAMKRASMGSTDLEWVAGQGKMLFVRSISSVNSQDITPSRA